MAKKQNNLKSKNNHSLLNTDSNHEQKETIPNYPIVEPTKEPEGLSDKKIEEAMENTTNPLNNRDKIDEDSDSTDKSKNRDNLMDCAKDDENESSDKDIKNNPPNSSEEPNTEHQKEQNSIIKFDYSKGRL